MKRKRSTQRTAKNRPVPGTSAEYFAMAERDRALWKDLGQIVTEVRSGTSLRQAALKFNRDPRTIQRLARPALRKLRNGRWAAKSRDKLLRVVVIPGEKGLIEIGLTDSRQASIVGQYWNAVERYQQTGDASALRLLRAKYIIDANGKRIPLLTDLRELDRLASAGVLSFETLYAGAA